MSASRLRKTIYRIVALLFVLSYAISLVTAQQPTGPAPTPDIARAESSESPSATAGPDVPPSAVSVSPPTKESESPAPTPGIAWIDTFLKQKIEFVDLPNTRVNELRLCALEDKNIESPKYGLSIVWLVIPGSTGEWKIAEPRVFSNANEVFNKAAAPEDFVVQNGGFFENGPNETRFPLGLIIADGMQRNPKVDWGSGGILLRSRDEARIVPLPAFGNEPGITEAIQSKPILVKDGKSGIYTSRPEYFNRTAVGLDASGNYICIGAFTDNGDAVSLYEFAELLIRLREIGGPSIQDALALDGGPSAHIYIPSIHKHYGYATDNYVPNVLRFCPKPKEEKRN